MVNVTYTNQNGAHGAERVLAIGYAPAGDRDVLAALFALDDMLASILRSTREPMVGQMRLTWWHEALIALDDGVPPAEPTLQALYERVVSRGIAGATLAGMIDGWEALLDEPLHDASMEMFATRRGAGLFRIAGRILRADHSRIATAGRGWALADLSRRLSDTGLMSRAAMEAKTLLDEALTGRWPDRARSLGALALSARFDVTNTGRGPGSPQRVARLMLHRLTGF